MKSLLKGVLLGVALVAANHLCCLLFGNFGELALALFSGVIFFAVTTIFLVSSNFASLFACGFCGLFVMVILGLRTMMFGSLSLAMTAYIGGFWGSMAGLLVSLYFTARQIAITDFLWKGEETMSLAKSFQLKLMAYALISAVSFSYLVMPENAGVSVPFFCLIQVFCLWFLLPDRKKLWFLVPVGIMALNAFFSASIIWRVSNLLLSAVLYCCMFVPLDFKTDSLRYLADVAVRLFSPFLRFHLPFRWGMSVNSEKAPVIRKVLLAVLISVFCSVLLIGVLANADMVFSLQIDWFTEELIKSINGHFLFLGLCGLIVGFYLFGLLFDGHFCEPRDISARPVCKGDLLVINILLSSVLAVYTLFVIVQFKYLFAGSALPDGLTYTEYARKGFFELLGLTGVNLAAILVIIRLTKKHSGKWLVFTKVLCHYLCGVTVVLLVSSFYRMFLYTNDDGLTRLRLFVMGFLVFEAIGLVATFFYIAKPKFNITLTYLSIALTYYLVLNVVPVDRIIAQNQINRYLNGECESVEYIYTLSVDAAPAMEKLYDQGDDATRQEIRAFLENNINADIPNRWQRFNLSVERARDFLILKYY